MKDSYDKWNVNSAGVKALKGNLIRRGAIPHDAVRSYLRREEILPLYIHYSQQITKKLLSQYYWILVMENAHKERINKLGVPLESRMFTVREFGLKNPPPDIDMPDPTGADFKESYEKVFDTINTEITRIADVLISKVIELEDSNYE